jgi:hypothetical protein
VRIPLSGLPPERVSFTYPDSMAAMELGSNFGLDVFAAPYHNRVFRLDELDDVLDTFGLPSLA